MKNLLFVGFLLMTSTAYGQIIKNEDEFTGQIDYRTSLFAIQSDDVLEAKGILIYRSDTGYDFGLYVYAREYQHMGDDIAYFLMDNERKPIRIVNRDSDYNAEGRSFVFLDRLFMTIDESFLKSISDAERTRFKIGENVYEFSPTAKIYVQSMLTEVQKTTE